MTEHALCPVFGECGGCQYQDISYPQELKVKETFLRELISENISLKKDVWQAIVGSPEVYHYRHRLDLKLRKLKDGRVLVGFTPNSKRGIVEVDACPIGRKEISDFIVPLKKAAIDKLTPKYKMASLVLRTSDDGRVFWGGIGRKSCQLEPKDYLWTEIYGRRIYFSLDTFFQANLSILSKLFENIRLLPIWKDHPHFFDLYGGVGLFSFGLLDVISQAYLIENCQRSINLAKYNVAYNKVENIKIFSGKVEDHFAEIIKDISGPVVGMIDPPRAGLSDQAREMMSNIEVFDYLLYLSCNPEALARDLESFVNKSWKIEQITPFDFFPRTKHVETLVLMKSKR